MKAYLHIGTSKTGTTTLQNFCALNRENLRKVDYLYPKSLGQENHTKFPLLAYESHRRDDLTRLHNIYSSDECLSFKKLTFHKFKQEVIKYSPENIIISSEHIQSRLKELKEIQDLREVLLGVGVSDIQVIVYLRDPALLVNSLHSTRIKCGATRPSPPPPSEAENLEHICNHQRTLKKFSAVFGRIAVTPRLFETDELHKGSIIHDFMKVIGLPWQDYYQLPRNTNLSLSATGLELLRRVNEKLPVTLNGKPNPLRGDISTYFERHFSTGERYRMPDSLVKIYDQVFKDSNEYVRANWFPARETLFKKREPWEPSLFSMPDDELKNVADLILRVWLSKQKMIQRQLEQRSRVPGYSWLVRMKGQLLKE